MAHTPSPCELVGATAAERHELAEQCHHERSISGMHQGMGVLANLFGIVDAGVQDELDIEANDPTFLGASDHDAHTHSLQGADQGLKGARIGVGLLDSFPGMIDQLHARNHPRA
ncbi:hypothetical protein KFE25_001976 [Diacronema lutheri]|uniref:Uncharacterized protein n=1 Tax=Diacronema lutheri TaxID=2081491 RepID=A0A8J6CDU1_DIALT|nr:hypothetical protein KFE25_001976 [Diacronema lutheri]|mmetsp:Transcript_9675/g.30637  ORF Transcript_9675/g.30637 Transcript_9675/m.30637 type:complete len:114 (-) Transcript_9675:197-538(-)